MRVDALLLPVNGEVATDVNKILSLSGTSVSLSAISFSRIPVTRLIVVVTAARMLAF